MNNMSVALMASWNIWIARHATSKYYNNKPYSTKWGHHAMCKYILN